MPILIAALFFLNSTTVRSPQSSELVEAPSQAKTAMVEAYRQVGGARLLAEQGGKSTRSPFGEDDPFDRSVKIARWYADNPEYAPKKLAHVGKPIKSQPQPTPRPPKPVIVRDEHPSRAQGFRPVSWYGKGFDGKETASGRVYNMWDPTMVAHKTYPFGTLIRFTNPENKRSIEARVEDRGPYVGDREFDLSIGAKEALGITTKTKHYKGAVWLQVERLS